MQLPDNYPQELSNEELIDEISRCSYKAVSATRIGSNYSLGPNFYKSMAELGQLELTKRIQMDLCSIIEKQRIDNRKSTRINWALSSLIIGLAIITLYIGSMSLNITQNDGESVNRWKDEQLELLMNNNTELIKIKEALIEKNIENSKIKK